MHQDAIAAAVADVADAADDDAGADDAGDDCDSCCARDDVLDGYSVTNYPNSQRNMCRFDFD